MAVVKLHFDLAKTLRKWYRKYGGHMFKKLTTENDAKRLICKIANEGSLDLEELENWMDIEINHTGTDDDFRYILVHTLTRKLVPRDFKLGKSWKKKLPCVAFMIVENNYDRFGPVKTRIFQTATFRELGI